MSIWVKVLLTVALVAAAAALAAGGFATIRDILRKRQKKG